MKLVRKIFMILLIVTVLASTGLIIAFNPSVEKIGALIGQVHAGYVDFKDINAATRGILISAFVAVALAFMILYAIQVRRKKSKAFSVYGVLTLLVSMLAIFSAKDLFNYAKDNWETYQTYAVLGTNMLACVLLLTLLFLSVPTAFEASELQSNSKRTAKGKIFDLALSIVIIGLYVVMVFMVSGGKFDVFKYFFSNGIKSTGIIILLILEVLVTIYLVYKFFKLRKNFVGLIMFYFTEFAGYTYWYYSRYNSDGARANKLQDNFTRMLASGNIADILSVIYVVALFFVIILFGMYMSTDGTIQLFENKRQKLYNHREKYVYGDRRRFGDSIVKEWENSKATGMGNSFGAFGGMGMMASATTSAEVTETLDDDLLLEQNGEELLSANDIAQDDSDDSRRAIAAQIAAGENPADFRAKLLSLEPEKRKRYNQIRNKLQSYKKIKQKFSKTVDTYRYAGELVAKISVLGTTLRLHLALDPDSYDVEKYHHLDLSSKQKYIFVPFALKLKGPKSVELALQLIDELMTGFDIPVNNSYKDVDYVTQIENEYLEKAQAQGATAAAPADDEDLLA